ncbi:MAG: LamG domain-containing protein, partial [Candidatus Paceibacterota bacterium]
MQSTNYIIDKDSINFGGSEESESESYKLSDTMGEIGTGESEEKCAAMSFDGVDDYINVGTDSSLNTGAYETVSAWVKRDNQLELYGGIYSDGGTDRRILISSSVLLAQYKIGGIVYSASVSSSYIPFGVWTHTVFTYDGTEICLWVNGVKRASTPATGIIRNPYQFFRIGWGHNETYHFTGSIDDVRIYNRALSADEISDLYNGNQIDDAGLVGYWGFDEGIGSTTADLSGNGNTGTIDGATFTGDTPSATCSILNAGYRQDDTFISTISISSPDDVILGPSFGGILGGTGTGSADWTVTTDDPAGYQVS